MLTSDHGNFEDLSVSTHTLNFVPSVLWGKDQKNLAEKISRIEDITGAILDYLKNRDEEDPSGVSALGTYEGKARRKSPDE